MPSVLDWHAVESATGRAVSKREYVALGNVPLAGLKDLEVETTHPGYALVAVPVAPDECIRVFTRRKLLMQVDGAVADTTIDTVVIEVSKAGSPNEFVRQYISDAGLLVSSEELNG